MVLEQWLRALHPDPKATDSGGDSVRGRKGERDRDWDWHGLLKSESSFPVTHLQQGHTHSNRATLNLSRASHQLGTTHANVSEPMEPSHFKTPWSHAH